MNKSGFIVPRQVCYQFTDPAGMNGLVGLGGRSETRNLVSGARYSRNPPTALHAHTGYQRNPKTSSTRQQEMSAKFLGGRYGRLSCSSRMDQRPTRDRNKWRGYKCPPCASNVPDSQDEKRKQIRNDDRNQSRTHLSSHQKQHLSSR